MVLSRSGALLVFFTASSTLPTANRDCQKKLSLRLGGSESGILFKDTEISRPNRNAQSKKGSKRDDVARQSLLHSIVSANGKCRVTSDTQGKLHQCVGEERSPYAHLLVV